MRDLVLLVQFEKREKNPWRSVSFSKVTILHRCFSRFLNCTTGTKSSNAAPMFSLLKLDPHLTVYFTAQKMTFFIKDFFSKCDQIRSFLRIWSHLLKKSLMENFIFCPVLMLFKCLKLHVKFLYIVTHFYI